MTSQSQTTVSVVIPAFNAEPWIGETLESVARQSYDVSTLEVLVVDDHSSDRTVDIATAVLKSGLPGGRIVRLPLNTGVSAARNIGWQQAKGDWIQFLDADDLISPEKLAEQSQFAALQTPDVAVVYSKWRHLKKIGDAWRPSGPIVEPELGPAAVADMLESCFGYLGPMLMKRSALVDVGGFRKGLLFGEDLELCMRLVMSGYRLRVPTLRNRSICTGRHREVLAAVSSTTPSQSRNILRCSWRRKLTCSRHKMANSRLPNESFWWTATTVFCGLSMTLIVRCFTSR